MKTLSLLFLLVFFVASAHGQTQERKLMDRVMKPDMQLSNPYQKKGFSQDKSQGTMSSSASKTSFWGLKKAPVQDYSFTRSFLGIKNPWFGEKVFQSSSADQSAKYLIQNAGREVPVKKAQATGYYDAAREANFGAPVAETRPYVPAPAAQGALSQIADKINSKMTIDQVRELLNKNR